MLNLLKTLTVTYYGATPNLKLFRMNFSITKEDEMKPDTGITYQRLVSLVMTNIFSILFLMFQKSNSD